MRIIKLAALSLLGILVSLVSATEVEPLVFAKVSLGGVSENARNGTVIGSLQANHGSEECTNCTFSIVGTNDYITVTADGVVTIKNAYLFDYEKIQYVNAAVRVTDGDSRTADTTIVIPVYDVNEAPVVQDAVFAVNENSVAGKVVGKITASDPDIYNLAFCTLTYSLVSESTPFAINSMTGEISVAAGAVLDYEKGSVYTLRAVVTDGMLSDTAVVTVMLNDVNEFPDDSQIQETVDCVNYEGDPDVRCVYTRLEGGAKGLGLYIVDVGEEPIPANALANTNFYVYAPKADSDSVVISLASDGTKIGHMSKVTSNDVGLATIVVDALYPISNFEIGTAPSADTKATIARVYNFYVPGVQYCLDENCNEPVTDMTALRPAVGKDLVIYARAYIPIGPSKGTTDTTLVKTFYIKSLASDENMRYYNVNGKELPSRPYGYQIDFVKGKAQFIIRAAKAVAGGPMFSVNSFIYFTEKGDTNFLVSEVFPGDLQFVNSDESKTDSAFTSDSSKVAADSTKDDDSGDSDKDSDDGMEFASPSFRIKMVGPFEFAIVMNDSATTSRKSYAVMDLQGRVLLNGSITSDETLVPVLNSGSYIVKVGIGYRRVNIR